MSNQVNTPEAIATQKIMATMPNYALWALLKVAALTSEKNNNDDAGIAFINKAVKSYEENKEMSSIDSMINSTLSKHLEGKNKDHTSNFIDLRDAFLKDLSAGKVNVSSAKNFLKELDKTFAMRNQLVEKEPKLANDYKKLYDFSHDLLNTLTKNYA